MMTINVTWRSTILLILGRNGLDHTWRVSQFAIVILPYLVNIFYLIFFQISYVSSFILYWIPFNNLLKETIEKKDYLVNLENSLLVYMLWLS